MPTYVTLHNFTDQGIKDIKNLSQRDADIPKRLETLGAKVIAYYMVMGEYDEVVIWEAPTDDVAMSWLLELGTKGNRRSVTLRAFSEEQVSETIEKLP